MAEPRVFLSFKHNRPMLWIAEQMKFGLEQRFVEVYRLIDNPRTGSKFSDQIRQGIEWSNALIVLWSQQGAASHFVKLEYRLARELRKPIALVLGEGDPPLPPDWNPDERYERLDMVAFPTRLLATCINPNIISRRPWDQLLDRLAEFARGARDGKVVAPPPSPLL